MPILHEAKKQLRYIRTVFRLTNSDHNNNRKTLPIHLSLAAKSWKVTSVQATTPTPKLSRPSIPQFRHRFGDRHPKPFRYLNHLLLNFEAVNYFDSISLIGKAQQLTKIKSH